MDISICIPVFNAEKSIKALVYELGEVLACEQFEIVLVNDGSKDNSEQICEELANELGHVKFISLRRNFGEHNAVMCGLNHTEGSYVIIMDDDFQNPPSEAPKLISAIRKGYDVVYSAYKSKKHSRFRNIGSSFNDIVATALLSKPRNLYLSSFKAISREIVDEIVKYNGPFPYIDGLILRVTNNIGVVEVVHSGRATGASNYTLTKLFSLWVNMFINFSIIPLRLFTLFGIVIASIAFLSSLFFMVEKIIYPDTPMGWTSLMVAFLLFSGIQLIFVGLIGEYVGKNYLDINRTPQWVIKKISFSQNGRKNL